MPPDVRFTPRTPGPLPPRIGKADRPRPPAVATPVPLPDRDKSIFEGAAPLTGGASFGSKVAGQALGPFPPPPGVSTLGDVHAAIQRFSLDPRIPFSYVRDGCYARAHAMASALEQSGIPASKIFAYAPEGGALRVPGAEWGYHVAPQVQAWNPKTGALEPFVVDPSISKNPMTPSEWVGKMNPDGLPVRTQVTLGEMYIPDGRGGYLTAEDPLVVRHRLGPQRTMEAYSNERLFHGRPPNAGPPDGIPTDAEVAASRAVAPGKLARLAGAASRGLGVLAAVGGGFQVAGGIQEWRQGNKGDGAVDMTSGSLNVLGGAAMATGVGTVAAPFLFGASSMIDGGRDLVHGVQNGDGEKIAVGAAKTAGGGMMIAGGVMMATGVLAPVGAALIAGGAIVAGGAALYDAFHDKIDNAGSAVVDRAKGAWKAVTSWF